MIYYLISICLQVFHIQLAQCGVQYSLKQSSAFNDAIGSFATHVYLGYFSHFGCIVLVTDKKSDISFVSSFTSLSNNSVLQVQVKGEYCNKETQDLYNMLEFGFSQSCVGYIIRIEQPLCILKALQDVSMLSMYRQNPRILFLPSLNNPVISTSLMSTKEIEQMPDVLVVDLKPGVLSEKNWGLELWTIDWLTGKILLADCELEQCLLIKMNLYPDKIKDLKGKELGLATFNYLPYAVIEPMDGSEVRIAQEYANLHNCTWRIVTDNEQWGEIFNNGTGNGILGAVVENRADIGLGALYLWYHEYKFLDFTTPYIRTGVTCLAPRPHLLSKWLLPLRPFNSLTWYSVFLTFSVTTIALHISNKIIRKLSKILGKGVEDNSCYTLSSAVLHVFSFLLLQPHNNNITTSTRSRFLLSSLQMMFLLIAASYSSGLASILTVPRYEKPIETVKDLVSSGLLWGATHDAWIFSLREAKEPYLKTLVKQFRALSKEQLVANGLKGNFAFSVERLPSGYFAVGDYITDKTVRNLLRMKEDIYWEGCIIVVRKGSPYIKSFNKLIHRLLDSGILLYWEGEVARRFLPSQIQSAVADSSVMSTNHEPTKIQISHVQGAFILLILGLSLAFVVFLAELYSKQMKNLKTKFCRKTKFMNLGLDSKEMKSLDLKESINQKVAERNVNKLRNAAHSIEERLLILQVITDYFY